MKMTRRITTLFLICAIAANLLGFGAVRVAAHPAMLEVSYDDCQASDNEDGIDETWYELDDGASNKHICHETKTIKYYISDISINGQYDWDTYTGGQGTAIKTAYANSMKKWNNVYFYVYDTYGNVTKKKLVNIVETADEENCNIKIYPLYEESNAAAYTDGVSSTDNSIENGAIRHMHTAEWTMKVNVYRFYAHSKNSAANVNFTRAGVGAHEMGHVLGLLDVDTYCGTAWDDWHHEELLMGYGDGGTTNITYKDIAGVAITRGFHTDADHKWLKTNEQSNSKYKLICSICNSVKYVTNPSAYTDVDYEDCDGVHTLSSGNMMAVASYGTKDYYKCKYCRYVAPFENNVQQNYVVEYVGVNQHRYRNQVTGLNYSIYEYHNYIYRYVDKYTHTVSCVCTEEFTEPHWVKQSEISGNYGVCVGCGAIVDLRGGFIQIDPSKITQVSVNGSYLLPSGIAVIVDADIEAYRNGTLVFYDIDDVPVTQ